MQVDKDLARLCASIYDRSYTDWDHLWIGDAESGGIYAGIKDNVLVFRGSITLIDWFRDFLAFPHIPLDHPQLGIIHAGFYEGMDEFFEASAKFLGPDPTICGHSLGAARAWLYAGRLVAQGRSPARITVFGSPRPGCLELANLLAPISKGSYRNGLDPVTEAPLLLGDHMAIEPAPLTGVRIEPSDWSEGFMAWHSIFLYQKALDMLPS